LIEIETSAMHGGFHARRNGVALADPAL